MLTAQKITKKNMPQLKAAAKKFVKQYGEQSVRASMGQFSGNTVFGIFDQEAPARAVCDLLGQSYQETFFTHSV